MSQPTSYTLLNPESVPEYVAGQPHLAGLVDPRTLAVREVGDGNLNLVFLCRDAAGRGLCLKQALPYVRLVGADWPLTPERAAAEARAYQVATRLAPQYVAAFYGFDAARYILALEALTDWTVWRTALNDGEQHSGAAADMGTYIARVAFGTSLFGLSPREHKARLAAAINPELCEITEDLVFTEPYFDHPHNSYVAELAPAVDQLRADSRVSVAVQALKYAFMTRAEGLIHGDLHTGSVMVKGHAGRPCARVIDPEFCFYGPIAFDLGALFGNYLIARVRAEILHRPVNFREYTRALPVETWRSFSDEMWRQWPERVDQRLSDDFLHAWLGRVLQEAIGFGACKAIRRVIGLAKVSDLQLLGAPDHFAAASAVLHIARLWLHQHHIVDQIADLTALTDNALVAREPSQRGP